MICLDVNGWGFGSSGIDKPNQEYDVTDKPQVWAAQHGLGKCVSSPNNGGRWDVVWELDQMR